MSRGPLLFPVSALENKETISKSRDTYRVYINFTQQFADEMLGEVFVGCGKITQKRKTDMAKFALFLALVYKLCYTGISICNSNISN